MSTDLYDIDDDDSLVGSDEDAHLDDEDVQDLQEFRFLAVYNTKQQAKAHMHRMEEGRYRYAYNFTFRKHFEELLWLHISRSVPKCHPDHTKNDTFTVDVHGTHTEEDAPNIRPGIDGIFQPEIDNLLRGGVGPEGCLSILRNRYRERPDLLNRLLTRMMLKSPKQYITRDDREDAISNYAALAAWAGPRECLTPEKCFGGSFPYVAAQDITTFKSKLAAFRNELLVLRCFTYGDNDEAMGVILSTRTLLRNVVNAINAQEGHGDVGAAEGTYKLHRGGWTLVDFGTYGVHLDRREYRHTFVPWAYMFVRSENIDAYTAVFTTIRSTVQRFFWIDLSVSFGSLDHSDAISTSFVTQWPDIQLLNCWPHFIRKANENGWRLLQHNLSWENTVLPSLQWLHKARTTKQFTALSDIVIAQLQSDNETDYAEWLKNEYLDDRWHTWFVTASGCPGVLPNQNPIEAHHKKIKTSNVLSLRASTAYVLRQSLPSILASASEDTTIGFPISIFLQRTSAGGDGGRCAQTVSEGYPSGRVQAAH